jgi:hypothetical protein
MGWLFALAFDLAVVSPSPADRCAIRSARADLSATVTPDGAPPFRLSLKRMAVVVDLPAATARDVPIDVPGPLAFRATTRDPLYRIAHLVVVADGMVRLDGVASASALRARGGEAIGRFALSGEMNFTATARSSSMSRAR